MRGGGGRWRRRKARKHKEGYVSSTPHSTQVQNLLQLLGSGDTVDNVPYHFRWDVVLNDPFRSTIGRNVVVVAVLEVANNILHKSKCSNIQCIIGGMKET